MAGAPAESEFIFLDGRPEGAAVDWMTAAEVAEVFGYGPAVASGSAPVWGEPAQPPSATDTEWGRCPGCLRRA